MRVAIDGCLRFVAAITMVWLLCSSIDTTASQQVRQMGHQNIPIEERLLPGDEIVEMNYWATLHVVSFSGESRAETIRRMARQSAIIGVVRVTRVEPFFVEDRSWLRTRVVGTLDDPVKGASKTFEAHCDGGEMRIKGVLVRAGSCPVLQPGATYLFFVVQDQWIWNVFAIDDKQRLRRPVWWRVTTPVPSPFDGETVQRVVADLRTALRGR